MRLLLISATWFLMGCHPSPPDPPEWLDALTFYASFDGQMEADFASGDPSLYTVPAWDALERASRVSTDNPHVKRVEGEGRYGDALKFDSDWNPVLFFHAEKNVTYDSTDWAGTFSFWLRVVPDEELREGYSDPFIVTDKNWDDASMYVDFTEEDRPRHFRFAIFSDKGEWNPEGTPWEEIAPEDRPMIDLADHPFAGGEWTHVVLTYEGVNTGEATGRMTGYLNGTKVGVYDNQILTITWDRVNTLMAIGRHYAGMFDELSVFNRALTEEEIKTLYKMDLGEML